MKVAICDDNQIDIDYLSGLLLKWGEKSSTGISLRTFPSAESFLFQYEDEKNYDLLFLDIEMEKMDGVTMARQVRKGNESVQIVFVTGYSDYIAEGYDVAALHYLMKPVKEDKLFEVLDRAASKIKENAACLTVEYSGELVRIPFYEIKYMDVDKNYVTIHSKEDYRIKATLGEMETKLPENFFRIGRSAIVNLNCIRRVTKTDAVLTDGSMIQLPRGSYDKLNRAIIKHV
jgi:DNA-binding LytR/AlgR family response regulator